MKKTIAVILVSIVIICVTLYALFSVVQLVRNKKLSNDMLNKAYEMIKCSSEKVENKEIGQELNNLQSNMSQGESGENSEEDLDNSININTNDLVKKEILLEDEIIGILKIPKLNVIAPIKDGTSQEVMKTCVGHFVESDYWDGNVSLASHNGGTNAHFFEKLKQLSPNDEIEYITKFGSRKYCVNKIDKISSYDWSNIVGNQKQNTITLITCINGLKDYRLCVRGVEIKNN